MASIEKRGNKYRITVYDGYNLDGKQIKRRKSWEPNANMTDYYEEQQREKIALGNLWIDSNRICIQWNGKPMSTNTPYEILQKLLKKYDLPQVSIHSLRHTNATIMIESGTDLKTTSARLGHSQTSTTMNIYVHQIKSSNEHAAENISKTLAI